MNRDQVAALVGVCAGWVMFAALLLAVRAYRRRVQKLRAERDAARRQNRRLRDWVVQAVTESGAARIHEALWAGDIDPNVWALAQSLNDTPEES